MTEDWDEHAKIWDSDDDARLFADQALASLLSHVDLRRDAWKRRRVLDFGCGTGLLTERLAPLVGEIVALDLSPAMLGVLRHKHLENVAIQCANIDDESVRSVAPWFGDFDLIVASSVCAFLPDYQSTVGLLAQALNPSGCFVQWDWLLLDDDDADEDDGLTLGNVRAALTKAHLNRVHVERAFNIPVDDDELAVLIGVGFKPPD